MAKEVDYKKVVCNLVADGYITMDEAKEAIAKVKEGTPDLKTGPTWDVALRCIEALNKHIKTNGKKSSRVNQNALSVMEKLHRIDKRSEEEIIAMIDWSQTHDFWSTVILSPENLRKNFFQMEKQRERDGIKARPAPVITTPRSDKWERVIEERRKESVPMPAGFKDVLKRTAK